MKIVILNNKDISGGAARAAYRLYKGLKMINQESYMVVNQKDSEDFGIIPVYLHRGEYEKEEERRFLEVEKTYIKQNRTSISNSAFSFPYPGYDLSNIEFVRNADIINLHNIRNFQSVETIAHLLELGKPVVWTLHDQMAFTGGCHYSANCNNYQTGCKDCPQLRDNSYQIPFFVLKNKLKNWKKNLTLVTPSRWLADCARQSMVLRQFRIEHIPNSLETDIFTPLDKKEAKERLNIHTDSIVLLFGTLHHRTKRKGRQQFINSIKLCQQDERFKREFQKGRIQILTFGKPAKKFSKFDFPDVSLREIRTDKSLATVYSASDVFILPSLEDNLPNTMLESLSCGTPVVAFEVGGIPDVLKNGINGYIVPYKSERKMAEAILKLVFDKKLRQQMGHYSSLNMGKEFHISVQAKRYMALFEDLLKHTSILRHTARLHYSQSDPSKQIILNNWKSEIDPDIFSNLKRIFGKFT